MSKVTSKLQVTIPKAIADEYGIGPGDEIDFEPAGEVIRVVPHARRRRMRLGLEERRRLFDRATVRQRQREKAMKLPRRKQPSGRDWKREDLYTRGESG